MKDGYLLAIDAGTGSCRAVLFDPMGNQYALVQREWSHSSLPAFPGSQIFETQTNWESICGCIREVLEQIPDAADAILAVSSTSMREGIVLYDDADREIWACPNVDSRATAEATKLVENRLAEKIYAIGGDWVAITSPPRLLWIQKHQPEVFERIAHFGMLSDWILFKFCGEYTTDPSSGSSSGLFDLGRRTWSEEILEICKQHNVPWGTTAANVEDAERWVAQGALFFEAEDEKNFIIEGATRLVDAYRRFT